MASGQSPKNAAITSRHSHHRNNAAELHDHMKGGTSNAKKYEPHPSYPMEAGAKRAADHPVQKDREADRGMQKRGTVAGQAKITRKVK